MTKPTLSILSILCCASSAHAAITISQSAVLDLKADSLGGSNAPTNSKLALVVSTTDNIFSNVLNGDSLTAGSTIGGSDDIILAVGSAQNFGGQTGGQLNVSDFVLTGDISTGDQYALYWFTSLTSSDSSASTGNVYGIARAANWLIPTDGFQVDGDNLTGSARAASFTVNAVPEPSSTALLGLGALALIGRRQRR